MSATRLFILGLLVRGGPMHGHQIRRDAEMSRADWWTDVKPGSLYAALHRMEAEGVVEAVRTEQEGRRPARTVYAATEEGRLELIALRDQLLMDTRLRPDPVDLALINTQDLAEESLRAMLDDRLQQYTTQLTTWQHTVEYADPWLTEMERMTIRHRFLRLQAEITWHEELLAALPKLLADPGQKPANPSGTNPGTAEPGSTEPGTAEPGTAQPGAAEPGTGSDHDR